MAPEVFDVIDIGSGAGGWVIEQSRRSPEKNHVAVDPLYSLHGRSKAIGKIVKRISKKRVLVRGVKISEYIRELIVKGQRTRLLNCNMPSLPMEMYEFKFLFRKAPEILDSGGKIVIRSEMQTELQKLFDLAKKHGLKPTHVGVYDGRMTDAMLAISNHGARKIFILEINL